jgi:hypothetical protein
MTKYVIRSQQKTINVHDLALLLDAKGDWINDESGEVYRLDAVMHPKEPSDLMVLLAAMGKLEVKLNHQGEHGFFLPHWKSFNSIEEYCEDFPSAKQCKKYDV